MTAKVVGLGHARADHLGVVERYPLPESRSELSEFSAQGGGTTATAVATLANFHVPTAFIGKVADDDFGQLAIQSLKQLKVDVTGAVMQIGRLTPYNFIILDKETGRRTMISTEGTVDLMRPQEVNLKILEGAKLLIVDGFQSDAQIYAAEEARRQGIRVVLDAGSIREGMGELVALSDVLISSERYASEVSPCGELEDSLVELSKMGPKTVVVTLGRDGSIGYENDRLIREPSFEVNVVDRTGSGDVYTGAFCYGLLQNWALEKCMKFASIAASLSCRALGSRAGLPELEEIDTANW